MESSSVCDENSEETGCSTPGVDSIGFSRTISDISSFSERSEEHSGPFEMHSRGWPIAKLVGRSSPVLSRLSMKQRVDVLKRRPTEDELELIREKFSKLLLGEDMSGSGKGVCTAVAISNAITNLYVTVFGTCYKLRPLLREKKSMWRSFPVVNEAIYVLEHDFGSFKCSLEFFLTPVLPPYSVRPDQVEQALRVCFHEAMRILQPQQKELDLLIVILPENNGSLYGEQQFPAPACCDGLKRLRTMAEGTTEERRFACNCIKQAAARLKNLKDDAVNKLPATCGTPLPFPISLEFDCSRTHGAEERHC